MGWNSIKKGQQQCLHRADLRSIVIDIGQLTKHAIKLSFNWKIYQKTRSPNRLWNARGVCLVHRHPHEGFARSKHSKVLLMRSRCRWNQQQRNNAICSEILWSFAKIKKFCWKCQVKCVRTSTTTARIRSTVRSTWSCSLLTRIWRW